MEAPAVVLRQPFIDGPVLVGGVVIQDGADVLSGGRRRFDLLEEFDELLVPAALGMPFRPQPWGGCTQTRCTST